MTGVTAWRSVRPDGRGTARWRRIGPWWRVLPDVVAHRLAERRLIPYRLQHVACRWRGNHDTRLEWS